MRLGCCGSAAPRAPDRRDEAADSVQSQTGFRSWAIIFLGGVPPDEKGRKVAIQIDLKRYGAVLEDVWDGLISESRRKEKGVPYEQYRANRLKRNRQRG